MREAKALAESTDAHRFEAELERLDGELTLLLGGDCAESVAEAFLRRALEVARQQEARGWELRVATSLARLW